MTSNQNPGTETQMDDTGGVSGTVNLTINLPEGLQIGPANPVAPMDPILTAASAVLPGTIVPYAGSSEPADGWLICDGRSVAEADYDALFQVIGTTYGSGTGSNAFNLPDLRGRLPLGLDNMGVGSADRVTASQADSLGEGSGAEKHRLTEDEMPAHDHDPSGSGSNLEFMVLNRDSGGRFYHETASWSHTGIIGSSDETAEDGEDQPHNNMPPYLSLNYLIKT